VLISPAEDAASSGGDAALILERCGHFPLEMYHLIERCTSLSQNAVSPIENAASPARDMVASPNSGYVTLLIGYFENMSPRA
jgi:hypothetical protein